MTVHDHAFKMRPAPAPMNSPAERRFASGDGWSVREFVCTAGPPDRPFEEQHDGYSISAVLEGAFTYRSDSGRALLYSGALLLGNSGRCFECRHEHGVGDRCVSVNFREDIFAEIAATSTATGRFKFTSPSLPPSSRLLPIFALLESLSSRDAVLRCEEVAIQIADTVVVATADRPRSEAAPTSVEARRVVDAAHFIECGLGQEIKLQDLAAIAGLSKYHFLRVFRRLVGMTPYQYLLSARLRRAARALNTSRDTVLNIAFDSGFGDLSTFNHRFRRTFGMTPTQYRAAST